MREQQLIGRHLIATDGDVVWVQVDGQVSLAEATAVQKVYEAQLRLHGRVFSVLNVARSLMPAPEVRKCMADWRRQHRVAGSAIIGASLPIRTMGALYLRAVQLLGLRTWPVRFVDSEAAAQAYLDELRADLASPV